MQFQFQLFFNEICYKISNLIALIMQCDVTHCVFCISNDVECLDKEHSYNFYQKSYVVNQENTGPNRHFPNLLECTQNNGLKLRRGIKAIEMEQFTCSENKFGKCLFCVLGNLMLQYRHISI